VSVDQNPRPSSAPSSIRAPSQRRIGWTLLALFLAAVALNILIDRFTPYTSEAFLHAPVVGVAPNVSGTIVDVAVQDNKTVSAGDLLFRIDPRRYQAALSLAEAALASASQQVGASTAALAAAEARVQEANAALTNQREQTQRVIVLEQRKVYSQAQVDTAKGLLSRAEATVDTAVATLEETRQKLGPNSAENPLIRQALAQLQRARVDLADTEVRAPVDGVVTNTVLSAGQFASAGRRSATVVDTASAWITANIPENSLTRIRVGDKVAVSFNVRPGAIYEGRVSSISFGVSESAASAIPGELQLVATRRTWLRDTQRIPVRIEMLNLADIPVVRVGSRASLVVLTADAGLVETLGRFWLRVVAIANYVF
jgi:multidrug resistance efflux pump